jgi:predicted amidohydrolase
MRIAVHHGAPLPSDVAGNLARIAALTAAAAGSGAQLLVLPQLFLAGPCPDEAAARAVAELSDGPAARRVAAIARERGIAILCGYLELCTGRLHDSALLVDAAGCALANYRRTHLLPGDVTAGLTRGQWLTVVPFAGRKLGILIGADIEAPEPARALALAGAEILLLPAHHGAGTEIVGTAVLPARAFENGLAIAYANADPSGQGPRSRLLGPDGSVAAVAEHGLAVADLLAGPHAPALERLAARRPRLYQKLAAAIPGEDGPRL